MFTFIFLFITFTLTGEHYLSLYNKNDILQVHSTDKKDNQPTVFSMASDSKYHIVPDVEAEAPKVDEEAHVGIPGTAAGTAAGAAAGAAANTSSPLSRGDSRPIDMTAAFRDNFVQFFDEAFEAAFDRSFRKTYGRAFDKAYGKTYDDLFGGLSAKYERRGSFNLVYGMPFKGALGVRIPQIVLGVVYFGLAIGGMSRHSLPVRC